MDRKQALIDRNKAKQQEVANNYYINQTRENPDPASWDANGLRGIWEKLYNSERYIAELEHKVKYYPPLDFAKAVKQWLVYPLQIGVLQFETLRQGLTEFKKELEKLKEKPKQENDFKLFGSDSYLPLYQNLWGRQRIVSKNIPVFVDCLARDCLRKINALSAKKGSVNVDNALVAELVDIEILRDKITQLSQMVKNRGAYADADFESWDSTISRTAELRREIDLALSYKTTELEIDRFITDLDALPQGEVFNTRLAEFKEFLNNNRANMESINTMGWVESSLKIQTAERKIVEYENLTI